MTVSMLSTGRQKALSVFTEARQRMTRHPLAEIRLTILAIAVFYTVPSVIQTLTSVHGSWYSRLGVVAGFSVLTMAWFRAFARSGFSMALDAIAVTGFAMFALAATDKVLAVQVLYMCAIVRALYGSKARRIGTISLLLVLVYLGSMVAAAGTPGITAHLTDLVGVLLIAAMMRLIERSVSAGEAGAARQHLLARVGTDLLAAEDPGRVFQLLKAAVLDVTRDLPNVRVAITLAPDAAGGATSSHSFPFKISSSSGSLRVDTSAGSIPSSMVQTVAALAVQASLAMDRIFTAKRWSTLVHNSSDMILVIGETGEITYASPAAKRVIGYEVDELQGRPLESLLDQTEAPSVMAALRARSLAPVSSRMQFLMRHHDNSWVNIEADHTNLTGSVGVSGLVLNCSDITETKALEDQLRHRAFHDPLTSLPNRALFQDRVEHSLAASGRTAGGIAVMFVDLDDFKTVNDSLGHPSGDQLLRLVGDRIKDCLRSGDTAARLGGDEFAILLDNADGADAVRVAERIFSALEAPVIIEGREVFVSCSTGIAVDPERTSGAGELLRDADTAMYAAKARGKARFQIYESGMHIGAVEKLELEGEIRRALRDSEFELYYQPVMALEGHKLVGFEGLIRWNHPTRGLLMPGDFLAVAEQSGQIVAMSRWVLTEAVRQSAEWELACGAATPWISVNVSAHHLLHGNLAEDVQQTLKAHDVAPGRLVLEITEGMAVEDADAIDRLGQLRGLGVRIALDDFGTGYSSLGYLDSLPIDIIKVDRSFLSTKTAEGGYALLRGIVALGSTLDKHVIVEGVETSSQLAAIRDAGTGLFAQGYLLGRPMPVASADQLLGTRVEALATA
jgi:diguanylate cyclase (GGDEF)-like protein/PAS domain S-box-containing protein